MAGLHVNTTSACDDSLVAKAEEMCLSPLKAIASPRLLKDLSIKNKSSTFKPENQNGSPSTNNSSIANRKSSHCEPTDFKIKKRVGVESTRLQALSNSKLSAYSSELADSDIDPERHESITKLIEGSKMRRL